MSNKFELEGAYLIASPLLSHETLRGALVYIYQCIDDVVYGVIVNKPYKESKRVGEYVTYPRSLADYPVWCGGPFDQDRVIAISRMDSGVYITDRLVNLSPDYLRDCLVVRGQCRWDLSALKKQLLERDWWLVGSRCVIPSEIPAEDRIQYIVDQAGFDLSKYVVGPQGEWVA